MLRVLCWIGRHDWQFTLNFVQPARFDGPGDCVDVGHYSGVCARCGARDLFRGPTVTAGKSGGET
jgi:fructose 1,6-bisphosphatase